MNDSSEFYIDTYNLFISLNQKVDAIMDSLDLDLSFGQYILLKIVFIQGKNKVSQKDLFHSCCLCKATISQHLKSLSIKGFIIHYPLDTDNRCKEIILTQKTKDCSQKIDKAMSDLLLEKMTSNEISHYTHTLKQIKKIMEETNNVKETNAFY